MEGYSPETFLPLEVIDKIVVFAADSGGRSVALRLSLVSRALHKCALKRLYHTLHIGSEAKLEDIFRGAISQQTWIASAVRVLIVNGTHSTHYDNLLVQVFSALSGLISVRVPWSAAIDSTCALPSLCRIMMGSSPLPLHLSHNITHLHIASMEMFSQVLHMKDKFGQLTHFFLTLVEMPGLSQFLEELRNELPRYLKILAVFLGFIQSDLGSDVHRLSLLQELIDSDNRIVFWTRTPVQPNWKSPRLLLFDETDVISQCLGALKDEEVGFWELAERHAQERARATE
ncbi:hypothetical protein DL96DRAFT_1818036 [Flagelloscypha sp. PMI_526]|nr:hypothetical protein DL96DRAFT_1818036 [Flagelloscypha sp. PMI_526]